MELGILTCSVVTQDLACSSFNCFRTLYEKKGEFSRYDDEVKLVGIINCAGCVASNATEKLLKRIRSLTELNPDVIHLSTCMIDVCPFKDKYHTLLSNSFPHIRFVMGTHGSPAGIEATKHTEVSRSMVNRMFKDGKTWGDLIPVLSKQKFK